MSLKLSESRWTPNHPTPWSEIAAPRNFDLARVRYGSSATDAVEAARACMSASLRKRTKGRTFRYVRLVPCVDGSELAREIFTSHCWSVQPCVRPVSAAHRAAGHNALRGSGPGQKPAFCDALALMGCPDRRIDRLCITCCSPSQPSHRAGCPARSRSRRKGDGFPVALAVGHQGPSHSGNLVGECDGGDLGRPPR